MNGFRTLRAAVAGALVAAAAFGASTGAAASDLESVRARAQAMADEVTALEHRLGGLWREQERLHDEIAAATRDIGVLELEEHEAQQTFLEAQRRYVERAVDAYKAGPTGRLEVLLSARSMAEMLTLAHATRRAASLDSAELDELVAAREATEEAQAALDARKQRLLAAQERKAAIVADIEASLAERKAALREMNARVAELERQARRAARRAAAEREDDALEQVLADAAPEAGGRSAGPGGPSSGIPGAFVGTGVTFEGIASWYGPGFEGNPTANGDIFDPDKFTAASLDLPLGSWLYVEHQGRGVVVYVNDRGPYIHGRILDLSQAAAEAIGISGLGWIEAEVVLKK